MSDTPTDETVTGSNGTSGGFDAGESEARAVRTLVDRTADAVTATDDFAVGDVFEVLSNPGRRYVLTYLLQSDGFVACSELVDYVAEQTDHSMTDEQFRDRIITELTHSDLPKLAECDLIEYNMERQIIGPTDLTPVVRPYLRMALAHQRLADRDR